MKTNERKKKKTYLTDVGFEEEKSTCFKRTRNTFHPKKKEKEEQEQSFQFNSNHKVNYNLYIF